MKWYIALVEFFACGSRHNAPYPIEATSLEDALENAKQKHNTKEGRVYAVAETCEITQWWGHPQKGGYNDGWRNSSHPKVPRLEAQY